VAVDRAGNLFIADTNNLRVREVVARTGRIVTVAGTGKLGPAGDGGRATRAALDFPYGIAVDRSGNLAISQFRSHTVRVVHARTGVIRTIAGTGSKSSPLRDGGPAAKAGLSWPRAVAYGPAGDLYIADTGHLRVRRVDARSGRITTVAGNGAKGFSGDGGRATAASVASLDGLAIGPDASIYLSDGNNHRIRRVRAGVIRTIAGDGSGSFSGDGGAAIAAGIADPQGLVLDPSGVLHVCDASSGRVRVIRGLH
jgi:sugar lactone lactonase YvrE